LKTMIEAHTAWEEAGRGQAGGSDSPLAQFCRTHGLSWRAGMGGYEDWPQYSDDNQPRAAAIGTQGVVHHEYTVSLPPTFGEFFYKRGGRVAHEENHAHHPIVTIASFWWGWTKEQRAQAEVEMPRLVAALTAPDGLLMQGRPAAWPAAWRAGGEMPLIVGVVFENLIDGVSALNEAARRHGAVPRFDVVVQDTGNHRPALVDAICEALELREWDVRQQLMDIPCTLMRAVPA